MAYFLYCFPSSFRSSNYCNSNSCRSFTLLKALAKSNGNFFTIALRARKSDNYRYRDSWKSNNFREISIKKEAKNWYQNRMQIRLRVITLQEAIEKSKSLCKSAPNIAVAIVERPITIWEAIQLLLSQYWKNYHFDRVPKIISHFRGINNILVDFNY